VGKLLYNTLQKASKHDLLSTWDIYYKSQETWLAANETEINKQNWTEIDKQTSKSKVDKMKKMKTITKTENTKKIKLTNRKSKVK
jgi:hypothetical protein